VMSHRSRNISAIVKEGYSAPEQYTVNNRQDNRSDIYALGGVLYRLVCGENPPNAPSRQSAVLNGEADPLFAGLERCRGRSRRDWPGIIGKAMALRPMERYADAGELQRALTADASSAVSGATPPISTPTPTRKGKSAVGWILASLVVVLGLGGLYLLSAKEEKVAPIPKPVTEKTVVAQEEKPATVASTPQKRTTEKSDAASRELERVKRELEEMKRKQAEALQRQKEEEARRQAESKRRELERQRQEELKRQQEMEQARLERERQAEQARARSFVERYLALGNQRDIRGVTNLYADRVDYFGKYGASRNYIYNDKVKYYRRWPYVQARLIEIYPPEDVYGEPDKKILRYKIAFDVYNPYKGRGIKGEAVNEQLVEKTYSGYRILADTQKILHKSRYTKTKQIPNYAAIKYSQANSSSIGHVAPYVCYDAKSINIGKAIYEGCVRSSSTCRTNGKFHFGKYPNDEKAHAAFVRCVSSNPRFVDTQGL